MQTHEEKVKKLELYADQWKPYDETAQPATVDLTAVGKLHRTRGTWREACRLGLLDGNGNIQQQMAK